MVLEHTATILQMTAEPKKTECEAGDARGTTPNCRKAEKTGDKARNEGETRLEVKGSGETCPHTCPALLFSSVRLPTALDTPSLRLAKLLEGAEYPGDSGSPPEPPEWLDRDLFNEGRKFYHEYLFCMTFSELLCLLLVLTQGHVLKPLIHTGRSDTPTRARRRYVSTLLHLMAWFEGDVWDSSDPAHRDLISVRTTHRRLGCAFNASAEYDKVRRESVRARGYQEPATPIVPALRKDLRASGVRPLKKTQEEAAEAHPVFISQLDMSLTQFSFMGLILAHPSKFGAAHATPREMEALVHFWRGLGWLLGVEDRYNFCSGGAEETRELCVEVERLVLLPQLAEADCDYEHMVHALIGGISQFLPTLSLPAMLRYLAHTLDLPAPNLASRLTWRHLLQYWLMRVTFAVILLVPAVLRRLNKRFRDLISKVKAEDRVSLAAYRKEQAALTVAM